MNRTDLKQFPSRWSNGFDGMKDPVPVRKAINIAEGERKHRIEVLDEERQLRQAVKEVWE
jgi:hypothetical protein